LIVVLGTRLTFFNDDWWFLLQRPGLESGGGLDVLLAPHNGNLVVLLTLLYKLAASFGFGTQLPFRLIIGITLAILGVLVFVIVAERVGTVIGLAAAAVVLFLGPAWEGLLFLAAYSHLGAVTFGVGALLALERDSPRRNAVAVALLLCATLVGNLGLAFVVGAAIAVLLRRRPTQLWIPGVPAVVFAAWWAFYGHKQPSGVTLHNIEHLPGYVWGSISIGLTTITGLNHGADPLARGHILAVIAGLVLLATLLMGWRPRPWILVFAGTALSFWILSGAAYVIGREPGASRYQVVDAVLLILIGAEWLRGIWLPRPALAAASVLALIVVVSNLFALRFGFNFMGRQSDYAKADLGALQIAGDRADPNLQLLAPVAHNPYLSGVTAGRYREQSTAHGAPAFDAPAQLAAAPAGLQQAADSVLASAYRLRPVPTHARPRHKCRLLPVGAAAAGAGVALAPGRILVHNRGKVPLIAYLRRFAPAGYSNPVGFLAGRTTTQLQLPRDGLPERWQLSLRNTKAHPTVALVCARG
jgi:hypothetical protein